MWGCILGFVRNTEIVKHFNNLAEQKVDQQILYLCKEGNYDIDLDTVLCQWKMLVNEAFPVDTETLNKKIKSDKGKISNWNKLVNAGGLHPIISSASSIICMLDGLASFLIYCCIMMYFQCPIGKFSLWLIIPVWIIATLGSYNGLLTCIPLWIPLMAYALQAKTGTLACLLIAQLLFSIVMLVRESAKLFKKVNS